MTRLTAIIALTLLALTIVSCHGNKRHYKPSELNYDGIDVSRHQKVIDWTKVACDEKVTFVYIKATEGATHTDARYSFNIEHARREGIKVGSYHFFSTTSSVDAQYKNFMRHLDAHKQDLIPMIDVEKSGKLTRSQLIDSVAKLANMLEKRFKHKPLIYSTMGFYNSHLAPQFNSYPLYIGRYSSARPQIKWNGKCLIWQYSEDGIVTGIPERVDLCTFTGKHTIEDILL